MAVIHILNPAVRQAGQLDWPAQTLLIWYGLAVSDTLGRKWSCSHFCLLTEAISIFWSPRPAPKRNPISHPQVQQAKQIWLQLKHSLCYYINSNHVFALPASYFTRLLQPSPEALGVKYGTVKLDFLVFISRKLFSLHFVWKMPCRTCVFF